MDDIELRLWAAVSRTRLAWWAASDPRLSARGLARELGVDPGTVSARLRQWIERGFLVERQFLPNPALFGETFSACLVTIDSPLRKPAFLQALADVDGAVAALDSAGTEMVTIVAHEGPAVLERRRRAIGRLPGVALVGPGRSFPVPPPRHAPSPLDWRLMGALRSRRFAAVEDVATALGVSARTVRRHHQALLEGLAVWCITVFDFTRASSTLPTALLVDLAPDAPRAQVAAKLREALPPFVEYPSLRALVRGNGAPPMQLMTPLASFADVEDVQRRALEVPGVAAVEASHPHRLYFSDAWAEDHLARGAPGRAEKR